jgi:hypothetical protein
MCLYSTRKIPEITPHYHTSPVHVLHVMRIESDIVHTCTIFRRSGGGPGGGRARMPVGAHPHLLVVDDGNPIAAPGLAR